MRKTRNNRYENLEYLKFVKREKCALHLWTRFGKSCSGGIEVHHLLKPFIGPRGLSLKSDDRNCAPLCVAHHRELHNLGSEKAICNRYMLEETYLQTFAMNLRNTYQELPEDDGLPF